MKKLTLTLKEKRFLIVWGCIHAIALTMNYVPIKGDIGRDYIFTRGYDRDSRRNFWPFSDFTTSGFNSYDSHFNGLFYGYDLTEFIVYALLGIAIVYLPKLFKE